MATTTATTQTRPYRSADRDAGANPLAAPLGVLGLLACPVLLPAWAVWAAALLAWTLLVRLVPALHRAPLYATPLAALALFGWLWRAGHADPFGGWLTQQGVDALASTKDGYLAAQHDAWAALWDASQTAAAGGELWVGQSRALLTTLPALWPAYTQAVGGISVVMGLGAALLCAFAGALRPSPSSPSESARSSSPASRTSPRLPAAPHTPYGGGGRAERRRDGETSETGTGATGGGMVRMWRSGGGAEGEDEAIEAGREQEPPPREWAVEGLIPGSPAARWRFRLTWRRPWLRVWRVVRGYITAVLGAGGVGKSYVLLDLGIAALIGGTWFGLPVRRVRSVLYVDTELEGEEFRRRAYPLARGRGLNRLPRGLHYLRLTASLAEPAAAALLRETVRRTRAGLVLVDSLSIGSYTVSLNDPGSMGRVLAMLESLGPPVVLIDHMGKDRSRGAAGTWVKQAKVRCELRLERPSSVQGAGGAIRVEHSKASFGPQREPFTVQAQRIGPDPNAPTCVAFVPLIPLVAQPSGARAAPVKPAADGWDDAVAKALSPMGDKAGDGAAERGEPSPRPLPVLPVDKREAPDGGDAAERGEPEPVPEVRAGPRDDVCRRILAWVREHQPDGAAGGELVGGLIDAGVCARAPAYRHLGHLVDDGLLLREGEGVPGSPHYYRHAAPRLVGDDTPKIDERPA